MCFHIALIKSTTRNKTRFFLSPFLISTSRFLILAEAFRNDLSVMLMRKMKWVATLSFRVRQNWHSVVAHRIGSNSSDATKLVATEHVRKKCSILKSRSVIVAVLLLQNLLTLSILIQITAQVNSKGSSIYYLTKLVMQIAHNFNINIQ